MNRNKHISFIFILSIFVCFFTSCNFQRQGWKSQSAANESAGTTSTTGSSIASPSVSGSSEKPKSVGVSSFLHDLFGTELPKDTDRYQLPKVEETKEYKVDELIHYADVYGNSMYFIRQGEHYVYAYDFDSKEERVFAEGVKNPASICTDADGVYVVDVSAKEVVYFTYDGKRSGSVPLPENPKDNSGGPQGAAWMLEKYYAAMRHYDGLLLLAARDAIWTIADGEDEWKRTEYVFEYLETVQNAVILNRKRIAVYTYVGITSWTGDYSPHKLMEMNRDGSNAKLIWKDYALGLMANAGRLCFMQNINGANRLYDITSGNAAFIQEIDVNHTVIKNCALSGNTLFIEWMGNVFDLIPVKEDWNTVRLIAPASTQRMVEELTNSVASVPLRFTMAEDETYLDKLSTSLLAGEADFDIALVTGEEEAVTTMLRALVQNGQCADLGQNAELSAHLEEAYPGLKDFLTIDEKIVILPLEISDSWFGFTETAQTNGIPLPRENWDVNDMQAYAEQLLNSGGKAALFTDRAVQKSLLVMSMAVATVQANVNYFSENAGAAEYQLRELFRVLTEYREAKVFSGDKFMIGMACGRGGFHPMPDTDGYRLALPPSAVLRKSYSEAPTRGKHASAITSFLFVNANSDRAPMAMEALADLTNEENRYNAGIFKMPLFPDVSKYYKYTIHNEETDEWYDKPQKVPAYKGENIPFMLKLDDFLGTYYSGSEPALIAPSQKAWDAVSDFCTGKMTGEDCAKILYEEFVYRIKG